MATKENNQLTGDQLPKLGGLNYLPESRVMVIDLNHPRRAPIKMTYKGWLLLTTNYVIIGPADVLQFNGNIKPFDKNEQQEPIS
jgi:hypothetical protein